VVAFRYPEPNKNYQLQKLTIVQKLTDQEADIVYSAMAQMPAKLRLALDTASAVTTDSEFLGALKALLTVVLGTDRAGQLLQQELPQSPFGC